MLDNLNIQKLYLVDPYVPYPSVSGHICTDAPETRNIAHDYLSEYGSSIEWVEKDSTNAVLGIPDDLDFIYIDGDHREIVVIADIKNYIKKVKIGGLVAGHDYDQSQVKSLVSRIFADELKIGVNYDWWVIKKDYHNESHWVDNRLG